MTYDGRLFGQWVRQQRKARDITQHALAQQIGCSESTLRKFEAGTRRPSRQIVELLVRFFGSGADEAALVMAWARLGSTAPVASSHAAPPDRGSQEVGAVHNLPARLTPLIGREHELAAVQRYLGHEEVRLLTLTGPPGVGKTRLAIQAALNLLPAFRDGVFFVGLALVRDPPLVAATIAQVLGFKQGGSQAAFITLAQALAAQQILLVLDNFEQVTPAAVEVVHLLEACPQLKVLVTSREALRVHGEQQFAVPPLLLPDPQRAATPGELLAYPAVALFVERARATQPDFQVTADNAAAVARICVRLDGLPLAIELAAARIRLLSPAAMLARLDHRLSLLTGGARNLPPRHQTLRNAIDWSYDLLRPYEQTLFARLSVFAGGCSLEAMEVVGGDSFSALTPVVDSGAGDDHPPPAASHERQANVLAVLESLLDQSLLHEYPGMRGEPRFTMLETIREYAQERLARSGAAEEIQSRHAQYYLAWAEEVARHPSGAGEEVNLDRLEQEHDNLRTALDWALRRGAYELAARIAVALLWFWDLRGYWREGRRWLEAVLTPDAAAQLPTLVRAKAAWGAGRLAYYQDDYAQAQRFIAESLQHYTAAGDKPGVAAALNGLASLAATQGDRAAATQLLEESLTISRAIGDARNIAKTLGNLGRVATDAGDYRRALRLHQEALGLFRQLEDTWGIVGVLESLGQLAVEQGDYAQGITFLEESLTLSRAVGDKGHLAWVLGDLGIALLAAGAYPRALAATAEALQLFLELGDQRGRALSLGIQGVSLAYTGDYERATASFKASVRLGLEIGDEAGCALGLEGLAFVAVLAGDVLQAGRLTSVAARLRAATGYKVQPVERPLHEQTLAQIGVVGDPDTPSQPLALGQMLEREQAIAYAHEVSTSVSGRT